MTGRSQSWEQHALDLMLMRESPVRIRIIMQINRKLNNNFGYLAPARLVSILESNIKFLPFIQWSPKHTRLAGHRAVFYRPCQQVLLRLLQVLHYCWEGWSLTFFRIPVPHMSVYAILFHHISFYLPQLHH